MATYSVVVDEFMARLNFAEENSDIDPLLKLFTEDARLQNLTRHNTHSKQAYHILSPEPFWRQYLCAFSTIMSHFTNVIDDGKTAVLEWHSSGTLACGYNIDYAGVSILEYEEEKIYQFRTYYDSAALLPHAVYDKTHAETVGLPDMTPQVCS